MARARWARKGPSRGFCMSIGHRIREWLFGPRVAELMTPGLNLWRSEGRILVAR